MSIIQQIRDKAAWLVFGLIALSLIGFLLMDARSSKFFGGSGGNSTVVGVINGQNIEYADFERQVTSQEDRYKAQNYPVNEAMQQNIRDGIWKQMVEDALLSKDYASLGLDISDKEINDMLVGADAIPDIKRAFTDPKTGLFDAQAAAQQINQLRTLYRSGPKKGANADNRQYEAARSFFEESVPQIIQLRLKEKFTALVANSAYVPKWMIEKMTADNSQQASISYVSTPYFTIPDSAAKVSDEEIREYINQHPEQFKQEDSRSVAYVSFNAAPSPADSSHLRDQLLELKDQFAQAKDPTVFLGRVGSDAEYDTTYNGKSRIRIGAKDSIFALAKGAVYGPYLDGGDYVLAKLVDEKEIPDSARARHILVGTVDPQTHQPTREDSTAKNRIDSIRNLIEKGGQNFDSVAFKLSDDGSRIKGGDLGWFSTDPAGPQHMVPEFNNFIVTGKKGDRGIVRSEFGYHYIDITDEKNMEPGYKVAYLSRKIEPSDETDKTASGLASQFAGESRDAKTFEDNIQKDHLQRLIAPDVTPSEFTIPGLGPNRQLVRWIYEAELGAVSEPYAVGDKYVVVLVTEINKAGIMTPAKARPIVEPILRNRKKAEEIAKKLGTPATLDAVSTASGQPILHADSLLFSAYSLPQSGREGKVIGAAFDKDLAGKPASPPIAGNGGVFVIRVEKVNAVPNPNADMQQQRFVQEQQLKSQVMYGLLDDMRKLATVQDNRGKF